MSILHQDAGAGRWFTLSLCEQLGNVGSEVGRAAARARQGNYEQRDRALERALELLDLIIADPRWRKRLKEICRAREVLLDTFWGDREYRSTPEQMEKYFYWFALESRLAHTS